MLKPQQQQQQCGQQQQQQQQCGQQQQQQQQLLLHESPHVFGKPWFWQRSSSSMESTRSLAHVIMEMRDEIKKLEDENKELRGDSGHWSVAVRTGGTSLGSAASASAAAAASAAEQQNVEEIHSVNLRRNVSAPVLDGQYKETSVMTVRRYSVGSNLSANLTLREGRSDRMRRSDAGWRRLQEEMHHGSDVFANSVRGETGKVNNRHSLQEYVHKNRAKVKTVTFLLPVDDIYTNRPVLSKHQGEPVFSQLTSIDETDS